MDIMETLMAIVSMTIGLLWLCGVIVLLSDGCHRRQPRRSAAGRRQPPLAPTPAMPLAPSPSALSLQADSNGSNSNVTTGATVEAGRRAGALEESLLGWRWIFKTPSRHAFATIPVTSPVVMS